MTTDRTKAALCGTYSLLAWALAGLMASLAPAQSSELGAIAPKNCWYVKGGCAARTGATLTKAVKGPLVESWTFPSEGTIEGEPLVWNDLVVICEKVNDNKRVLKIIDLDDGRRLATKSFKTSLPLAPSIWNRRLLLRTQARTLELFRINSRSVSSIWRYKNADADFMEPLLVQNEVYVATASSLLRLDVGQRKPTWRQRMTIRGAPCRRGDWLYFIRYSGDNVSLVVIDHLTGKTASSAHAGPQNGVPKPATMRSVHAGEKYVFALFGHTLNVRPLSYGAPLKSHQLPNASMARRGLPRPFSVSDLGLHRYNAAPVMRGDKVVVRTLDNKHQELWGQLSDDSSYRVLATKDAFSELLKAQQPATIADNMGIINGCAFDLSSNKVFWRLPVEQGSRIIPTRNGYLSVRDKRKTLVAWTAKTKVANKGEWTRSKEAVDLAKALVMLRGGHVENGSFSFDPAKRSVEQTKPARNKGTRSLASIAYIEDRTGQPEYWAHPDALEEAMVALFHHLVAKSYHALARKPLSTNDPTLIRRLLNEATARGSDGSGIAKIVKQLTRMESRQPKVKAKSVAKILAEESALSAKALKAIWKRDAKLPKEVSTRARNALLRAVLKLDPENAEVRKRAIAQMPKQIIVKASTKIARVLDFADAALEFPFKFVELPEPNEVHPSFASREYFTVLHQWKPKNPKNIIAIQSQRLLVIGPADAPGRLIKCVETGEFVCEVLEKMFSKDENKRGTRNPLLLIVHADKKEYLANSRGGSHLGWTAGHYSPFDRKSRLFIEDKEGAFERNLSTFAHELTHHWIDVRCPYFKNGHPATRQATPGYWIVEGFASLIGEARIDPRRKIFEPIHGSNASTDVVSNATEKQSIPWRNLLAYGQGHFSQLPKGPHPALLIHTNQTLGLRFSMSPTGLFYQQATALSRYLFAAEDGKYRQKLLHYLADYEGGVKGKAMNFENVFGFSPEEAGNRARAFAKKLAGK
ncbi:MAG: hypothetical protein V3W41_04705 [Planctomycetota bacterium]